MTISCLSDVRWPMRIWSIAAGLLLIALVLGCSDSSDDNERNLGLTPTAFKTAFDNAGAAMEPDVAIERVVVVETGNDRYFESAVLSGDADAGASIRGTLAKGGDLIRVRLYSAGPLSDEVKPLIFVNALASAMLSLDPDFLEVEALDAAQGLFDAAKDGSGGEESSKRGQATESRRGLSYDVSYQTHKGEDDEDERSVELIATIMLD